MKWIMGSIILVSICWVSCFNEPTIDPAATKILADTSKYTTIVWLDSIVNFGSIKMGEQTKVVYRFKNTGNQPLFLANVKPVVAVPHPITPKEPLPRAARE